jgi:hypothetical protein
VQAVEPAALTGNRANHPVHDEPMIGPVLSSLAGSSVNKNVVGKGVVPDDLLFNNNSFDFDQFIPRFSAPFASYGNDINDVGPASYSTLVGSFEKHLDWYYGERRDG